MKIESKDVIGIAKWIVLIMGLFVLVVVSYLVVNELGKRNSKVCNFIGNVWTSDKGCITQIEFYGGRTL